MAKRVKGGRKTRRNDEPDIDTEQASKAADASERPYEMPRARRARYVTTPEGKRVVLFRCGDCGKAQTRPAVEPDRQLRCLHCMAPLALADVGDTPPPLPREATQT